MSPGEVRIARRATRAAALASRFAVIAAGLALFAAHASLYRDWIIDDAGISFAYARNWAHGAGLASQPGVPPVEGYSNPLWVLVLAAMERIGCLVLPLAPKIASGALVGAAFAAILAIIARASARPLLVSSFVVVLCALQPAFVIWCTSGLENALYVATVSGLAYGTLRTLEATPGTGAAARAPFVAGAAAVLVATTRPDGVVFALVPLAAFAAARRWERATAARYTLTFGAGFGLFLAARLVTFHQLFPNTAVVKGGPRASEVIDLLLVSRPAIDKIEGLLESAVPAPLTNVVFGGAIAAAWLTRRRGGLGLPLTTLLLFAVAALADYLLLPADWMREERFGTAFFPLAFAALAVLGDRALEHVPVRRKAITFAAAGAALTAAAFPVLAGRALRFAREGDISLAFVRRAFAERFDRYAVALGVPRPSVLLPDVGGMLLWSHARVYDLAGLCDAEIARIGPDRPEALRQHVLGDLQPTFIHAYSKFARMGLEQDPRFARDYEPIHAYDDREDPAREGHASGIFVRRSAVVGPAAEARLEAIRRENHDRYAFLVPPRPSALLRWLERTPIVPPGYRAASIRPLLGQGDARSSGPER